MRICEYIAAELAERGVKYVFGIPGGPSIPYMEELKKKGIDFILCSNETSAGIMADVCGRLGSAPGVCHATFGPGATNLATGVGGALLDRTPLIAFTTEVPLSMSRRTTQMNIDHHALFEPLTKASVRMNPERAGEILNDAFDLAISEYPGPIHIGLPSDIANEKVVSLKAGYISEEWEQETLVDSEIMALIEYAKLPLLVIGLTATRYDIASELLRFLEINPLPVLLTPMAKGILPEDHPSYCGVLFHALSNKLEPLISECDLVIGFGYDPVEYNYESWMPDVPLIHINTIKTDMPCGLMAKQLIGNPEGILDMVSSVINHKNEWKPDHFIKIRDSILNVKAIKSDSFGPVALLNIIESKMTKNDILCLDVGSHIHLFGQLWETIKGGKTLMTNGWSGMGFAIPAAIAAALIYPEKNIVAVTGDGGFLMTAGEIATIRRLKQRLTIIVLSDRELNLIRLKQEKQNVIPDSINLYDGNLFEADKFLGIDILNADSADTMDIAFSKALGNKSAHIINAQINPEDYAKYVIV